MQKVSRFRFLTAPTGGNTALNLREGLPHRA